MTMKMKLKMKSRSYICDINEPRHINGHNLLNIKYKMHNDNYMY